MTEPCEGTGTVGQP